MATMDERRSRCPDIVVVDAGGAEWLSCLSSCYESVVVLNVLIWPRCYAVCLYLESDPLYTATRRGPTPLLVLPLIAPTPVRRMSSPTPHLVGACGGRRFPGDSAGWSGVVNTGRWNRCRNLIAAFLFVIASRLSLYLHMFRYNIVPLCTAPPLPKIKYMQPGISYARLEITQLQTT